MHQISYGGEFGHELVGVTPYAYWLHKNGEEMETTGGVDTDCFYYFSNKHNSTIMKRACTHAKGFDNQYTWVEEINESKWIPPEYKKHFKNNDYVFDKPICVISNKYNSEWNVDPINYISVETLDTIFKMLKDKYQIIYNRIFSTVYINDGGTRVFEYNDFDFIKENYENEVLITQNLSKNGDSFNTVQCKVMANSDCHISVQGGNSVLASYFGGTNIIYALQGGEVTYGSYKNWFHKLSGASIIRCDSYESLLENIENCYV